MTERYVRHARAWLYLIWAFDPERCIEVGCTKRGMGVKPHYTRCRKHYQVWYREDYLHRCKEKEDAA
jgi:hypothetical protein